MKKWKTILAVFLTAMICAAGIPQWTMEAWAASAVISFSDPQVKVGEDFSVNVKIASSDGNIGNVDLMLKYDSDAIEFSEGADASGGAGSIHVKSSTESTSTKTVTYTLKFKALAEGTSQITVDSSEIYDTDSKEITVSKTGQSTITVSKDGTSSSSASSASDASAATNENASLSTQTVDVDGTTYTVAQSFDNKLIPDGFSENSMEYKDASVECAVAGDMTLLYLVDSEGTGSFFIYDAQADTFSRFITINVEKKMLIVQEPDDSVEIPEGFTETTIELNGNYQVTGWTPSNEESPEYCLIYGQTAGGTPGLYSYDLSEKTIQRYFSDPSGNYSDEEVNQIIDSYNQLKDKANKRMIVMIVLAVAALIFFFTTINLLLRRKDRREEENYEDDVDAAGYAPYDRDEEYVPDLGRDEKKKKHGKKANKESKADKENNGPEIPIHQTAAERAERLRAAAEAAEKAAQEAEAKAEAAKAAMKETEPKNDDGGDDDDMFDL